MMQSQKYRNDVQSMSMHICEIFVCFRSYLFVRAPFGEKRIFFCVFCSASPSGVDRRGLSSIRAKYLAWRALNFFPGGSGYDHLLVFLHAALFRFHTSYARTILRVFLHGAQQPRRTLCAGSTDDRRRQQQQQ